MNAIAATLSALVGIALGLFFYGGLWFTVRRLMTTEHPVLLALGSFWIRVLAVLAAFVLLTRTGFECVAIAMAGFIFGRLAVSRFVPARRPVAKCT